MLEKFIQFELEHNKLFPVFIYTFFISSVLLFVTLYFSISIYLLFILIALSIAYPITKFIEQCEREEFVHKFSERQLLKRHSRELLALWTIFGAFILAFFVIFSFLPINEVNTFQIGVSGISEEVSFLPQLLNSLGIFFLIFILCLLSIAAIVFVIQWSAMIMAHSLVLIGEFIPTLVGALFMLSSSLLIVGGYILAGFAGILLSIRFDIHDRTFKSKYMGQIQKDVFTLLGIGLLLVVGGVLLQII
ncbi:MAG: hypothetical protein LAT82_04265 [Nanoarchaeota archaeon]|nr:hypothetical protein [Nanoarchaeota archaeon]